MMSTENYKFPANFVWGAATSSYQIEGAVSEDGKGEDIWDIFTKEDNRIFEHHTGEIACDHYHRFKEDVKLMKEHIGADVKIKAAGGIRSRKEMEDYIKAGCSRIGTSSAISMLGEL